MKRGPLSLGAARILNNREYIKSGLGDFSLEAIFVSEEFSVTAALPCKAFTARVFTTHFYSIHFYSIEFFLKKSINTNAS